MKQVIIIIKEKDPLAMIFNICKFLFFSVFYQGKEENEEEVAEAAENGEFAI